MGVPAPHKIVLKDLLDEFRVIAERFEAAAARMESALAPQAESFPVDPAAQAAADKYVEARRHELMGEGDGPYE